jgi:hypothetical protein
MFVLSLVTKDGYFLPKVLGHTSEDIIREYRLETFPREEINGAIRIYPPGWAPVYYRIAHLEVVPSHSYNGITLPS